MPKRRGRKSSKLDQINKKLDKLIKIESKQSEEQDEDSKEIEKLEKDQLKELEELEKDLKNEIGEHPLRKITQKDIAKGVIGALVGVISHFVFVEGVHLAEVLPLSRIGLMYIVSFIIGAIFLYATGFRKVKQVRVLKFLPIRVIVIYMVSLVIITLVLTLFQQFHSFEELFRQVGVLSLPAIIGASAADLIGD